MLFPDRFFWALVPALVLASACGSRQSGTQTGDEGDVPTPSGICPGSCDAGLSCCAKSCVSLETDNQNCGGCGKPCAAGQYCKRSVCTPIPCEASCASGAECCGSACCSGVELCCDDETNTGPTCREPTLMGVCPGL